MTNNGTDKMVHDDAGLSQQSSRRSSSTFYEFSDLPAYETNTSFSSIASREILPLTQGWRRSSSVVSGIESPTMPSPVGVSRAHQEHHHHKIITVIFVVDGKRLAYKINLDYDSELPTNTLRVLNVYLDDKRVLRKSPRPPKNVNYKE